MAGKLPYVTGNFELVLDGWDAGIVNKIGGGNCKAEQVKIAHSTSYLIKNQIGNVSWDDFTVSSGLSMGQAYKDWIDATMNSAHMYKSGEARVADYNLKNVFSKEFKQALLTEIAFPACDAASKEPSYLNCKFKPEHVKMKKGDDAAISKPFNAKQTLFRPENFRLTIDGLEATTAKCSKIESLVIKQTVTTDQIGDARIYENIAAKVEHPNLKITFTEVAIEPIMNWFDTFVIQGNNGTDQEKTGSLVFLDATRQKTLLELGFVGLGIFSLAPTDHENNAGKMATVTAEMYCDKLEIKEWPA